MRSGICVFTPEQRRAYEMVGVALAIYQLVDNEIVTLLVSDGLCEMAGRDRMDLIRHYNTDMFGTVHPDDVEMLAQTGYRFAREEDVYDVTYRTKLYNKDEYRLVHTIGKFQTVKGGYRVAVLIYTDVTNVLLKEKAIERKLMQVSNEALAENKQLAEAVANERKKVEAILVQTVLAVSRALDAKDAYTCQHSERVARYASAVAHRLNWSQKRVNDIYYISMVHDIGKIGIPDALLMKPAPLTKAEYEIVKRHVVIGSHILKDFTAINNIYEGILYHHERFDGSGYVFGLKGKQIPIEARIIGIADAVDAMYSTRPYRQKQSMEYIVHELKKGKRKQFDPELVDVMLVLIGEGLLESDADSLCLFD